MARAIPVLPDDDSRIVCPGRRLPSFSASSIIALAARSLTEPPGFWPSSLARMRTRGFGLSFDTSTMGVFPTRSSTDSYTGNAALLAGSGKPTSPLGILPRQDGDRLFDDLLAVDEVRPHRRRRWTQRD